MKEIIKKYKSRGFKLTPQRIAIIKFLEDESGHPTADQIYRKTRRNYPTVSFSTVYNTLQALIDMGELQELTIDPDRKHYDTDTDCHHHIICTGCNRIKDVYADYSASLKLPDEIMDEFTVTGNHVDFYGLCSECRE